MQTELEYATKLSAYYFDAKRETTYVILKIRNKRAVSHLSIHDVLKNKEALDSLHPIDLCIIGVLANKNSKDTVSKKPTILPDDFLMMKIPPVIEIICRDYQDGHEIYTLELKQINKKIKITPSELYENQDLLNALKYQDALALGYSIGEPPQFLSEQPRAYARGILVDLKVEYKLRLPRIFLALLLNIIFYYVFINSNCRYKISI